MAEIVPQDVGITGLEPVYGAAADGADTFKPNKDVMLHFKTTSTACVITISPDESTVTNPNLGDLTVPNRTLSLDTTEDGFMFIPSGFGASVDVGYSDDTGVTRAALKGV